jgi:hypothetical protein
MGSKDLEHQKRLQGQLFALSLYSYRFYPKRARDRLYAQEIQWS